MQILLCLVTFFSYHPRVKNHVDNAGIKPGSPAPQASTLSITPSTLGPKIGNDKLVFEQNICHSQPRKDENKKEAGKGQFNTKSINTQETDATATQASRHKL